VLMSTAAMPVKASMLVVLVPLDVCGFYVVLARDWHGQPPPCETGTALFAVQQCSTARVRASAQDGIRRFAAVRR
jgi:hypothetical protein